MAVNWSVVPSGMVEFGAVIAMETKAAEVTVKRVEPVTPFEVALMVAVPTDTLVARPLLFTVATEGVSDAQVAFPVRFFVVPSEKVPVAVNCWVVPNAIEGSAGVTAMDSSTAVVTVSDVFPGGTNGFEVEVAEIVTVPGATPVACP